jgi:LysR family glycine cleavage system transcriptional activator
MQSLTKAAQSLNVTHGAISHQIKSLEGDLGVRLIERAGRGIRLTDEGERFARRVRTAFAELTAAVTELADAANPRQLRVSVVPSFAARWLLPRIGRFVAASSRRRSRRPREQREHRLRERRFRHGDPLRFGDGRGSASSSCSRTGSFPCAARALRTGDCRSVLPTSPTTRCCAQATSCGSRGSKPRGSTGPSRSAGPMFNDSAHLIQAAAEGQGIALARTTLLGTDERNGVLVRSSTSSCRRHASITSSTLQGRQAHRSSRCSASGCTTRSRRT